MAFATTISLIDTLRDPGTSRFSMPKLMGWLELPAQEVAAAAGVHRNTLTYHPESRRLQDFARNVVRVVAAFRSLKPDADDKEIAYLLKNYPLGDFGQKTPIELIEAGRTDDVVGYLESFRAGFVG